MSVYCRDERRCVRECGLLDLDAPQVQLQALMAEMERVPAEDCGCVGLCRDHRDYVEMSPVGNGEYFLWSDRLTRAPGWFGWLRRGGSWDRLLAGPDDAMPRSARIASRRGPSSSDATADGRGRMSRARRAAAILAA
ncbi:MAG: hypothetical protein ACTHOH_04200 [Lysobacteraceae bacterium]